MKRAVAAGLAVGVLALGAVAMFWQLPKRELQCAQLLQGAMSAHQAGQLEAALHSLESEPTCTARDDFKREHAALSLALADVISAEKQFAELAQSHPDDAEILAQWGYTLAVQRRDAEAEKVLLRAVAVPQCQPRAVTWLREVMTRAGHLVPLAEALKTTGASCREAPAGAATP